MTDAPTRTVISAKPSMARELAETIPALAIGLALATAFQAVAYEPFTIPSASMEPGLVEGDYLVVSKFAYGWSRASLPLNPPLPDGRLAGRLPERGDVVVFRRPSDPREIWIKRVIGLPGDVVEISGGVIFVNGEPLAQRRLGPGRDDAQPLSPVEIVAETTAAGLTYQTFDAGPDQAGDDRAAITVPEGQLFVMGDHRDNSLDSRWPAELGVGLLPTTNLVGRAERVIASWQAGASLFKPWTWLRIRPGRALRVIV